MLTLSPAKAPQNDKHTSPLIQKAIIYAHAQLVRKRLEEEQGNSYYCIMADETRDASKKEQLALVNRFVDQETSAVKKRLVDLQHVLDMSADMLCTTIVKMQSNCGHKIDRAQG